MRKMMLSLLLALTVASLADARRIRRCRFVYLPVCPPVAFMPTPLCVTSAFMLPVQAPLRPGLLRPRLRAEALTPAEFLAALPTIELEVDEDRYFAKLEADSAFTFNWVPVQATTEANPATNAEITLGVFNHAKKSVDLTIAGKRIQLDGEEFVRIRVARKFTWGETGTAEREHIVPDVAEGMELIIRHK